MDENDLKCLDKYLDLTRAAFQVSAGRLRRVIISWRYLADGSTLPELEIEYIDGPYAQPVEP